ncbi:DUF6119 family protein [Pantoea ananatis]|nr:DUF6119 family protein [Pantoea ananatis]
MPLTKEFQRNCLYYSKINLKNFKKSISNFGYEVRICKIPVDPLIYKKKLCRPKNKL